MKTLEIKYRVFSSSFFNSFFECGCNLGVININN